MEPQQKVTSDPPVKTRRPMKPRQLHIGRNQQRVEPTLVSARAEIERVNALLDAYLLATAHDRAACKRWGGE